MPDITAADAARNFADLLDAVEHRGETYTIIRRGKVIAHLEPVSRESGLDAEAVLRRNPPDADWVSDLEGMRAILDREQRR